MNSKECSNFRNSYKTSGSTVQSPLEESQNFVLRLSDTVQETSTEFTYFQKSKETKFSSMNKVIVISDSSESSSPEKLEQKRWNTGFQSYVDKSKRRSDSIMIEESSSSDESDSESELNSKHIETASKKHDIFRITRKMGASYTSDETIRSGKTDNSSKNLSDSSHVSPTPRSPNKTAVSDLFLTVREPKTPFFTEVNPSVSSGSVPRKYVNYKGKEMSKVTRAKRPVYFSDIKKATESTDSRADTRGSGSSEDRDNRKTAKQKIETVVIDETLSDTDEIPGTQFDPPRNVKPHIDKLPNYISNQDIGRLHVTLSERKRKEITNWILTNSPDSRSSSSCSNISESNRGVSSGNSSLERLEMKYETPNNRGKLRKPGVEQQQVGSDRSGEHCQTTSSRFLEKSKTKIEKIQTPKEKAPSTTTPSSKSKKEPENLGLLDCADVLDNLYGNVWRKNADVLLQSSEPRRAPVSKIDRAVQTEKKKILKSKYQTAISLDSDSEDEVDIFLKNAKTNQDTTKKLTKGTKKNDSFIDDGSSSELSGESIYHTALSHQRPSNEPKIPKKISENVKHALAICDPDTDEDDVKKVNKNANLNRRRLLFSDESNDSGTSEFDPEDQVPPKSMPKKDFLKVPYYTPKTNIKSKTLSSDIRGTKSFLASLSVSVPLSEAHEDAKVYRTKFKETRDELSKKLYKMYNEKVFDGKLPTEVPIEWNVRMRGTAGYCYNKRSIKSSGGIVRSSRIQLATKIIDTPDRLRDTLIHEMCHAAAWLINEVSDGHGPFWKSWVNKAMKAFPELPPIKRCHDYKIATKYTYRCTGCGYSIGRHSKSLDTDRKRCGYCYGKFEVLINKTTKSGTVQTKTPSRSKEPSGFALYVKENYNSVKQNRRSMKHGEVMKILGQQFSAIKIAKKHDNVEQNNLGSPDL